MTEGIVKFFNRVRKFGFITGDDGKEYFVHESGVAGGKSINEGDRVKFDVMDGDRGPKAENVKVV